MAMSVAEAADVFEKHKRTLARIQPELDAAADVLKAHFRKNGKRDYKGRIGYAVASRDILDSPKVKAELADRLPRFMRTVNYETLSLLK